MYAKDRTDYRCMDTRLLIEEARYEPSPELAVALAERLEATIREAAWAAENDDDE